MSTSSSTGRRLGRTIALLLALALSLVGLQAADGTSAPAAQRAPAMKQVAHTKAGSLASRISGTTGNGRTVTGSFVPLKVARHNGHLLVRGLVQGVVHERNGTRTTFAQVRTLRVKTINGVVPNSGSQRSAAAARATCQILNLVLGPLDLDLLGLQVHLDRVVLRIVAVSGAGNLLGNLLCAVAGLLDGTGVLGQLTGLLNQILAVLRLG